MSAKSPNSSVDYIIHDGSWTRDELETLHAGDLVERNGKRFRVCRECRQIVRMDKPIIGSLHVCIES